MTSSGHGHDREEPLPLVTVPLTEGRASRIPEWLQVHRVPVWWFEILLVVVFDLAYEHVRNLVKLQPLEAINRGIAVLRITEWFHLDLERAFNGVLVNNPWLATIANYDYAMLHLPLTAATLIWIFWKHRDRYLAIRNVLMLTTLFGLVGFWVFPMAPPRLLPGDGFVDTVVFFHTWGSNADPKVAAATNQFAAMPSLHCAWALWVGLCLFFVARNRFVRGFGVFYPLWTVFVVLGTGNHFLLDAIGGATCVGLSALIVWKFRGRHPWAPPATADVLTNDEPPVAPQDAESTDGSVAAPEGARSQLQMLD